jgi:uroporphyrinogen III methyltransferase / synthase
MTAGKVYLVGAGPGDPGLITVRGVQLLEQADCVLYDSLANESLLEHARADAELVSVGKRSGAHSFTQDQINRLIVSKAREGRIVVRLKGGDPCMFGRGSEEAAALAQAGIEFEIVPGVTSAIAAAEYAAVMLTDRQYNSQVMFVTGHEAEGKLESGIDWDLLARFRGSIVFYMGLGSLASITAELLSHSAGGDLPVCVIENATLPQQRVVHGTLSDICRVVAEAAIGSPALVVVGRAARGEPSIDWFARRPLRGLRIVVTRDARANREFTAEIAALGGTAIAFESMRFRQLTDGDAFIAVLAELSSYDWLAFTSGRGVETFFDAVGGFHKDARVLGGIKVACVGTETAKALSARGVQADFVPEVSTGVALAKELMAAFDLSGKRILLLRSALAEPEMAELLTTFGAVVNDVACYTSEPAGSDATAVRRMIETGQVDWLTFTSGSAVRAFLAAVDTGLMAEGRCKVASIGPVTSAQIAGCGLKVDAEATEASTSGILRAIMQAEGRV